MMPQSKRWSRGRPWLRSHAPLPERLMKVKTIGRWLSNLINPDCRVASSRQLCSKLTDGARHFFDRRIAKSEDQTLAWRLSEIRLRERPQPYAPGRSFVRNLKITEALGQSHCEMHACLGAVDFELWPQLVPDIIDQRGPAFAIK